MPKKYYKSIMAHFRELLVSKGTPIKYMATISIVTILGTILAAYIQIVTVQIPAMTLHPIALPIVASYWLAAYLPYHHFNWMIIYLVTSLVIYSFLFLPILMRTKFSTRLAFISIQISIIFAYILINYQFYKVFIRWMSV